MLYSGVQRFPDCLEQVYGPCSKSGNIHVLMELAMQQPAPTKASVGSAIKPTKLLRESLTACCVNILDPETPSTTALRVDKLDRHFECNLIHYKATWRAARKLCCFRLHFEKSH